MSTPHKRSRNEAEDTVTPAKNAFSVLLAASQKRRASNNVKASSLRRKSAIRFIPCPAGCGQHISAHNVNRHLDQCMDRNKPKERQKDSATKARMDADSLPPTATEGSIGPIVPSSKDFSTPKTQFSSQETNYGMSAPPCLTQSDESDTPSGMVTPSQSTQSQDTSRNTEQSHMTRQGCSPPTYPESASPSCPVAANSPGIRCSDTGTSIDGATSISEISPMADVQPNNLSFSPTQSESSINSSLAVTPAQIESKTESPTLTNALNPSDSPNLADESFATKQSPPAHGSGEKISGETKEHAVENVEKETKSLSTEAIKPSQLFAHMMARSKKVFSAKQAESDCECWFWYTRDGVSIQTTALNATVPVWSSSVKLRAGPTVHLATSIPSAVQKRRYVQHHSRLSVPVLKSILQKSIRRRKPLPSVRVALELADKSLGDFLRRLPVIILEDSTLHPDIGILVWLMMAHSKDYEPPAFAMEQVFRVVFEIASCQWQDHLPGSYGDEVEEKIEFSAVMDLVNKTGRSENLEREKGRITILNCIWSLLARAAYGGMQGDVRMLHGFASQWLNRVQQPTMPLEDMASFTFSGKEGCSWLDLPFAMHEKSREQSTRTPGLFIDLVSVGLDYLRFADISVEGVDFHCSAVIEYMLKDEELVQLSIDLQILSNETDFPDSDEERLRWLSKIWKSCMWDFGSGVNYRRPLIKSKGGPANKKHENLWKSLAAEKAQIGRAHV